jgi:hypothetical protein
MSWDLLHPRNGEREEMKLDHAYWKRTWAMYWFEILLGGGFILLGLFLIILGALQ